MSLTSFLISGKLYDDVKLLIQEINKKAKAKQQQKRQQKGQRERRGRDRDLTRIREQQGGRQRDREQRGERAVTPPFIQTNAGLFAAFHM